MKNIFKLFLIIFTFILISNFAFAQDDSYTGIGVYLNQNRPADTYPTVERVVRYSPAAVFRIQPGDKLMSVSSYDTMHLSNDAIINLLRGPAGSQVTVIVQNNSKNRACTIMRNRISESNPSPAYYASPYYGNQQYIYPYYYTRPYYTNGNYARNISYNQNSTHHYQNPKTNPQSPVYPSQPCPNQPHPSQELQNQPSQPSQYNNPSHESTSNRTGNSDCEILSHCGKAILLLGN